MDSLELAIILGAVQGLTEMLPISSSAHLIVFSWLLGGEAIPLSLNVALHFGTLLALCAYFWRDFWAMILAMVGRLLHGRKSFESEVLVPAIVVGTLPAAAVGLFGKDLIAQLLHHPYATAFPLAAAGIILWLVDKNSPEDRESQALTLRDGWLIGVAQCFALLPGVSRSGATITAARALGLPRQDAARFSFFLGTSAIAGASLLHLKELSVAASQPFFWTSLAFSAGVGVLTIGIFLKYLARFGFLAFAIYRTLLAAGIVAVGFMASS